MSNDESELEYPLLNNQIQGYLTSNHIILVESKLKNTPKYDIIAKRFNIFYFKYIKVFPTKNHMNKIHSGGN